MQQLDWQIMNPFNFIPRLVLLVLITTLLVLLTGQAAFAQASYDLMRAAHSGDLPWLKSTIEAGADIDARDASGSTALMLAASSGHIGIVRELLSRGVNVNFRNDYGWTPLMLAKANRHMEIVRLMQARGSDYEIVDKTDDVPIFLEKKVSSPPVEAAIQKEFEGMRPFQVVQTDIEEALDKEHMLSAHQTDDVAMILEKKLPPLKMEATVKKEPEDALPLQTVQIDIEKELDKEYLLSTDQADDVAVILENKVPGSEVSIMMKNETDDDHQPPAVQIDTEKKLNNEQSLTVDIAGLLEAAERHMDASRLTRPAHDNAYTSFLRVLEHDQQNRQAKDGMQRIASYYEKRAADQLSSGAFRASLNTTRRGLKVLPDHAGLQRIQSNAQASLNAKKAQQRRIAPAQSELREKVAALNKIEKKLEEQEQRKRESVQTILLRRYVSEEDRLDEQEQEIRTSIQNTLQRRYKSE